MASSSRKAVFGSLSILIFIIVVTYLLFITPLKTDSNQPSRLDSIASIISSLNIVILYAYLAFGYSGGIALAILTIIMSLFIILRTDFRLHFLFVLPFFATTFVGYMFARQMEKISRSYALRSEDLDEEINMLSDVIAKKKNEIEAFRRKLDRYSTLKEIAETFSAVLSLADISNLIVETTYKILGREGRALLFLVDTERQELALSASRGAVRVKSKKGDHFDLFILSHRRPSIIADTTKDFRFSTADVEDTKGIFRSLIAAPLVNEDKIIGILRMDNTRESAYTQDDLRILDFISDLAAVVVNNALLYSRTQELAIRDGLTGIFLRRYFMERFDEELKRVSGKKGVLSLLILDIDHFKSYNDRYGHIAGDLVLKHMARTISLMLKEGDILARYGGEEMVILLSETDKESAVKKAEIIRRRVEDEPLMLRREKMAVTVSIGLSNYPKDAVLREELMMIADNRLYKAKASGRNRICAD